MKTFEVFVTLKMVRTFNKQPYTLVKKWLTVCWYDCTTAKERIGN